MELEFIGIGSAFTPDLGNTSCFYREGNNLLLIDCGSDVYRKIRFYNLLSNVENIYIFCTHTHQDHVGSMATLISYCSLVLGIKVYVVLPNDETYVNTLHSILSSGDVHLNQDYEIIYDISNAFSSIEYVSFFSVSHCVKIQSFGIVFHNKTGAFTLYSGDSNDITIILEQINLLLADGNILSRAYVDCNLQNLSKINPIKPHELLEDLISNIPEEERYNFYVMHYDSYKCREEAAKAGFSTVSFRL